MIILWGIGILAIFVILWMAYEMHVAPFEDEWDNKNKKLKK